MLSNITLTLKYNSKLICLGQLWETDILYHDHLKQIILKQGEKIIESAIRKKNLFVLNTLSLLRTMLVKERNWPIYLISKNLQISLWYRQLGHISNVRVIKPSKLTNNIRIIIDKILQKNTPLQTLKVKSKTK